MRAARTSPPPELFSDGFHFNPYPTLRFLRANAPLYKTRYGVWIATRYSDVVAILKEPKLQRDFDRATREAYGTEALDKFTTRLMRHWIVNQTPDFHPVLREYFIKSLSESMERAKQHVGRFVGVLLDRVQESGRIDLVADLTFPLTAEIICEIVGVPPDERAMFVSDSVFPQPGLMDLRPIDDAQEAEISAKSRVIVEYLTDLCVRKAVEPGDDFASRLIGFEQQDEQLTRECTVANLFFMFFAGHQSTQNLLSNCLYSLYSHDAQVDLLLERPELIRNAAQELVRFDTSVQTGNAYYAQADVTIGDTVVPKGDAVMPFLGAANRDPSANDDPDTLNVERKRPRHVSFSPGPHFCIGGRLAVFQLTSVLEQLLTRFPQLELDLKGDVEYLPTFTLRGARSIPAVFPV